jgi:hypothetical protein
MRRLREETGATALMVAILLVVLLGLTAMVVDVGNGFWERRMLQNAADAAVIAAAQDLAVGDNAVAEGTARDYANANNRRGAFLEEFTPDLVNQRVTVVARTGTIDEEGELSSWFASVLPVDTYFARARAVAAWGAAGVGEGFPLGVCQTFWEANRPTNGPGPLVEVRYKGNGANPAENDCLDEAGDNFNPGSQPGNFSWLNTTGGQCVTEYDFTDGTYTASGDTGANLNQNCHAEVDQMIAEIQAHKNDPGNNDLPIRVIPVYSSVSGTGNNATYELVTLGAFQFSGIKVSPTRNIVVDSWNDPLCRGGGADHLCVQGRFVYEVTLSGTIVPGIDSDVIAIEFVE